MYDRIRLAVQRTVAHVADDADDLGRRLLHVWSQPAPDHEPFANRIPVWPVLARHGLIDDHDARRTGRVLLGKVRPRSTGILNTLK